MIKEVKKNEKDMQKFILSNLTVIFITFGYITSNHISQHRVIIHHSLIILRVHLTININPYKNNDIIESTIFITGCY